MNALLERPATRSETASDLVSPPDMLIDFATMTWSCAEHGTVMRLDSGQDCPECGHAPPDAELKRRFDALVS